MYFAKGIFVFWEKQRRELEQTKMSVMWENIQTSLSEKNSRPLMPAVISDTIFLGKKTCSSSLWLHTCILCLLIETCSRSSLAILALLNLFVPTRTHLASLSNPIKTHLSLSLLHVKYISLRERDTTHRHLIAKAMNGVEKHPCAFLC